MLEAENLSCRSCGSLAILGLACILALFGRPRREFNFEKAQRQTGTARIGTNSPLCLTLSPYIYRDVGLQLLSSLHKAHNCTYDG